MYGYHVLVDLGAERRRALLAEAEQGRLAEPASARRPLLARLAVWRPMRPSRARAAFIPPPRLPLDDESGEREAHLSGPGRDPSNVVAARREPTPCADAGDGSGVRIRPVTADDAPLLEAGFARLSVRSRYQRFLSPKNSLSPAELRFLTDVDHHH